MPHPFPRFRAFGGTSPMWRVGAAESREAAQGPTPSAPAGAYSQLVRGFFPGGLVPPKVRCLLGLYAGVVALA